MPNKAFLKDLSSRISSLLPMAAGVREDVEQSVQAVLQGAFTRLNLVTREEFDAQLKVLARAEQTIARMEEKIAVMEQAQGLTNSADREDEKQ